ncbi:hypothetical protein [Paenibacillus fonticola]|uniref:hypothetical protein n=1 Tax=Paenibacillus fonticola TaxID=379896 RepID=UPI00036E8A97|nr:hypothetical protein [Paenibacillus fonticola]
MNNSFTGKDLDLFYKMGCYLMKERYYFIYALVLLVFFSLFIHPTLYKYTEIEINDQTLPVKINRLTNNAKVLTSGGWLDITK